jgi:2-keto-4-pentenoate hydratase/2-oxohepta-3-ene-1,7-dioic acid hydratase in catechol pathway
MRLVSFGPVGAEAPGVLLDGERIVPLSPALVAAGYPPLDMNSFLALYPLIAADLEKHVLSAPHTIAVEDVRLGPPITSPQKVIVVGGNYQSHLEEATAGVAPSVPVIVYKPSNTVIGPNDPLVRPPETEQLDYETELVVVIGRGGHRISRERAYDHVAGYMVGNDATARDVFIGELQVSPIFTQFARGKGFPTFSGFGPWLATPDEIADPHNLSIRCWVNGDLRQDGSTSQMILDVPSLVESVSSTVRLSPGDVLFTGTPAGVGMKMDPPQYLKPGDVVEMEITGLGRMRTPVVDEG